MNQASSTWAPAVTEPDQVVLSADGVPIHFQVYGNGPEALVLVHGWCCHGGYWARQIEACARRYTVVVIDLAGHGASGAGRTRFTIPAFGQDVAAVVKQLRLDQVVLVGHSMGGLVITAAAAELPVVVRGLIGVDTWWNVERTWTPALANQLLAPFHADYSLAAGFLVRHMLGPTPDRTLAEQIITSMLSVPPQVGLSALEEMTGYDLGAGLDQITAPKMAINAAQFRETDREAARRHGLKMVFMSGVGHFVMLEAPEIFQTLLDQAVEKCLRPAELKPFTPKRNFDGSIVQSS